MIVSCVSTGMDTVSEKEDCLQSKIVRAKCNKYKESVSLKNTNHVQTYVVHIGPNNIKVICNFVPE